MGLRTSLVAWRLRRFVRERVSPSLCAGKKSAAYLRPNSVAWSAPSGWAHQVSRLRRIKAQIITYLVDLELFVGKPAPQSFSAGEKKPP
jgi:hypothetical protein